MLSAIAIVPSAPVMVPELAASAAAELADLREAVFAAAASLPSRWIAIGVGPADALIGPAQSGTFAGYGVDLRVALSPDAGDAPGEMPLCALITAGCAGRSTRRRASRCGCTPTITASMQRWTAAVGCAPRSTTPPIRSACSSSPTERIPSPRLRLAATTPTRSPVQAALDDALAGGDTAALTRLPHTVVGRVAYQVLAGLTGSAPRSAKELYRGSPYGVGYFAGVWHP